MSFPPRSRAGLWAYFVLTLGLSVGFLIVMAVWNFTVIDEIFQRKLIMEHVEAMTTKQRHVHIVTTATLDVLYPFAYGGLLAGLTWHAFPAGRWLAWPILVCIPVDLIEGVAQILILSGHMDWVGVKVIVTPIKLGLFGLGCLIGIVALIISLYRKWRPGQSG